MKILVIRRDNIGDLVCTTPMLAALRQIMPDAWIGVLVNQYNVAVMHGNPDVNEVFAYRKAKHREPGESKLAIWMETARLMWRLRLTGIDVAIIASPGGERYAKMVGARRIVPFKPAERGHEVERCMSMLRELAGREEVLPVAGSPKVTADTGVVRKLCSDLGIEAGQVARVAVHISARRPKQRWSVEAFAATIRGLLAEDLAKQVLVFWAPGSCTDPAHPGDDEKLAELMAELHHDQRIIPVPTHSLTELVAGLSLVDLMVCADGGAMHVAAGLGKPIVCLFGDSNATRWHPWGVPQVVIQPESHHVKDVSPEEALAACRTLLAKG
ncbi:glycosyltransferase family 9 protein [Dechloromonas sp. XY25]|uniref:Glycosyltransferase family 9 protein n=1 Tax=Dechloromonas hankyongensis TaxID=2908002 RepID=A0ABS9JYK3_9RHOO|nr:glycosyltransferase family 9 protein [Dechloromonas hankyongensis]MCG2575985.1 glycosyltransferase family 9 protein [Dechloromonas hankyongensis]